MLLKIPCIFVRHIDHDSLQYLLDKMEAKLWLIWWILLLKEFNFEVKYRKGYENKVEGHLSLPESNNEKLGEINIDEAFSNELTINILRGI